MARKKDFDTQDFKPVKRYSEKDYRFEDEEFGDEEYDEEYEEESFEEESFLDKFTKERMIRLSAVFAGVVVIIIVFIAFFVRGKKITTTIDNINTSKTTPTPIALITGEDDITQTGGTIQGIVQVGCLNVTIIPGYVRPDSSVGGGGYTPSYSGGGNDEPQVMVTPTPAITEDITPEITEDPTVTIDPENPTDPATPGEDPTNPENPTDPVITPGEDPVNPENPTDPVEPVDPVTTIDPENPAEPAPEN